MAKGKIAITPTQAKVVKAKVKAELNDIPQGKVALEVYPHMTPNAAAVQISRELKKPNVQEALQIALAEHGLTVDTIAGTVSDALGATRVVEGAIASDEGKVHKTLVETDVPDHSIRLKAAGMTAQFMGIGKQSSDESPSIHFHNHQSGQQGNYGL